MDDPITELSSTQLDIHYAFEESEKGHICRVTVSKDREIFDCYGAGQNKYEAQVQAACRMLALLKLLFPMVPLTFFSNAVAVRCEFTRVDYLTIASRNSYEVFFLPELKVNFYLYANRMDKTYCVIHNMTQNVKTIITPACPLQLLNDPVRYTDWSQGPIIGAQEAYLSKRLEDYYLNI